MSKVLEVALAEVINTIINAKDFILAELPETINQLLMWYSVQSGLLCLLGFVLLVFCFIYTKSTSKRWDTLESDPAIWRNILSISSGFMGFRMFFTNFDWLKIWIAPKIWLIEYASDLVKPMVRS